MTLYCYDSEFLEDGQTIELISIGIVCEDGREYYAVNADMDVDRVTKDDWLRRNVVVHLPGTHPPEQLTNGVWRWSLDMSDVRVRPRWVIANEVRAFLLHHTVFDDNGVTDPPELWAYYGAYDHVLLAQLWGRMVGLPRGVPMWTHDLMQELERMPEGFKVPAAGVDQHDALADARWNMRLLKAMNVHVPAWRTRVHRAPPPP